MGALEAAGLIVDNPRFPRSDGWIPVPISVDPFPGDPMYDVLLWTRHGGKVRYHWSAAALLATAECLDLERNRLLVAPMF